ncbi:MAG: TetR/AcrR family transcriptional regulator [Beijerinckiaceae bacterium]
MPKLTQDQQAERRARILDAAERCFARSGFRGATMQDICREAGVSPGALYTWFDSKEAIIGGIVARNRDEVLASFAPMAQAGDFMQGMAETLAGCVLNQPRAKSVLCLEVAAEATRNPAVAQMMARFDEAVSASLAQIIERAAAAGQIAPTLPTRDLVAALNAMAEGLFWRRAVDPVFDGEAVGRAFLEMAASALRPCAPLAQSQAGEAGAGRKKDFAEHSS